MAVIVLAAGTDVGEMALFDVDGLPTQLPYRPADFASLAMQERLVRFPTGSDGGYLLHLFADEPIPDSIKRYCVADDGLTGDFCTSKGQIAFGGLESAYAEFEPNPFIRADGSIEAGRYTYKAYRTEFPDELVEQATRVERTRVERFLGGVPAVAVSAPFLIALVLVIFKAFLFAALASLAGVLAMKFIGSCMQRFPTYRELTARRELAQLAFPSIVVELRSLAPLKTKQPDRQSQSGCQV